MLGKYNIRKAFIGVIPRFMKRHKRREK